MATVWPSLVYRRVSSTVSAAALAAPPASAATTLPSNRAPRSAITRPSTARSPSRVARKASPGAFRSDDNPPTRRTGINKPAFSVTWRGGGAGVEPGEPAGVTFSGSVRAGGGTIVGTDVASGAGWPSCAFCVKRCGLGGMGEGLGDPAPVTGAAAGSRTGAATSAGIAGRIRCAMLMSTAPPIAPVKTSRTTCPAFTLFPPLQSGCAAPEFRFRLVIGKIRSSEGHAYVPRLIFDRPGQDRSRYRAGAHGGRHRYRLPPLHSRPGRLRVDYDRVHQLAWRPRLARHAQTQQDFEVSGLPTRRTPHLRATLRQRSRRDGRCRARLPGSRLDRKSVG